MNWRSMSFTGVLLPVVFAVLLPLSVRAEVETYMIDEEHSSANWKIRHLFSKVSGTFSDVSGKIWIDRNNINSSKVDATINVYSIDSNHQKRDSHLLSKDFFQVEKYPFMRFLSTSVEATGRNEGVMSGKLTIHGVTRSVKLPFKILGFGPDPWGGYRSGFEAKIMLKRSDFGINYGLDQKKGGSAVGDEVEVTILIEGIKLAPDGAPFRVQLGAVQNMRRILDVSRLPSLTKLYRLKST